MRHCLYDFLVQQYRKIYLIENPVYHALYPIGTEIKPEISAFLLTHFNEDAGEDCEVGELSEYTNIYGNSVQTVIGIICCYNHDESILIHEKIEHRTLPQIGHAPSKVAEVPEGYLEYLRSLAYCASDPWGLQQPVVHPYQRDQDHADGA